MDRVKAVVGEAVKDKVQVKVRAGEWVVQVRGQARDLVVSAYARSAGQNCLTREESLALNIPAPSVGQR